MSDPSKASVPELVEKMRIFLSWVPPIDHRVQAEATLAELALRAAERARLQEAFEKTHAELNSLRSKVRDLADEYERDPYLPRLWLVERLRGLVEE